MPTMLSYLISTAEKHRSNIKIKLWKERGLIYMLLKKKKKKGLREIRTCTWIPGWILGEYRAGALLCFPFPFFFLFAIAASSSLSQLRSLYSSLYSYASQSCARPLFFLLMCSGSLSFTSVRFGWNSCHMWFSRFFFLGGLSVGLICLQFQTFISSLCHGHVSSQGTTFLLRYEMVSIC